MLKMRQADHVQYLNHPGFKKETKLQSSLFGRLLRSYHEEVSFVGVNSHLFLQETYELLANDLSFAEIEAGYFHTTRPADDARPKPKEKKYLQEFDLRAQLLEGSDMRENVLLRNSIISLYSVLLRYADQELESEEEEAAESEEEKLHSDNVSGIVARILKLMLRTALLS
jgi:hypothetical protein